MVTLILSCYFFMIVNFYRLSILGLWIGFATFSFPFAAYGYLRFFLGQSCDLFVFVLLLKNVHTPPFFLPCPASPLSIHNVPFYLTDSTSPFLMKIVLGTDIDACAYISWFLSLGFV
ncbi:hypothetical protein BGX38DRAFT_511484 [Terfezia claveryi]|nr:hypothetical protein BGX38DRAFT_511484 [Terfezia claveryi]